MPGGRVYKDHTFNKETAQYMTQIFTVQYKYMNIHSTIQLHEHKYNTGTCTLLNTDNFLVCIHHHGEVV
jgi:hypothetical protein